MEAYSCLLLFQEISRMLNGRWLGATCNPYGTDIQRHLFLLLTQRKSLLHRSSAAHQRIQKLHQKQHQKQQH